MKLFRITGLWRKKKSKYEQENPNLPHKKFKYEIVKKLRHLAGKTKRFLHARFPKRIWPNPREDRKGPRF
jgi:hypothetical protein